MIIEFSAVALIVIGGWQTLAGYTPKVSFEADCTTGAYIKYGEVIKIPDGLTEKHVEIILQNLLGSTYDFESDEYSSNQIPDEWFYEESIEGVLYAAIVVREKYYLQVAIDVDSDSVKTVVCDSKFLKQKNNSIHRNVKRWKDKLDARVTNALHFASIAPEAVSPLSYAKSEEEASGELRSSSNDAVGQLLRLSELRSQGLITDVEFQQFKDMLLMNSEAELLNSGFK